MSASFARPSLAHQTFRASLKAEPEEARLSNALHDVEQGLDRMQREIAFRVDNDAPGANHAMLDTLRRYAGDLLAAADEYQRGAS